MDFIALKSKDRTIKIDISGESSPVYLGLSGLPLGSSIDNCTAFSFQRCLFLDNTFREHDSDLTIREKIIFVCITFSN